MRFRPCIDIHNGKVKQLVGGTLENGTLKENFVAHRGAEYYARLYAQYALSGGHVILLNSREKDPENYEADKREAFLALGAFPGGMQAGGGIVPENCGEFLDAGASHVIVTSYIFTDGRLDERRLMKMSGAAGRERLVLDLSCRAVQGGYIVATDRWSTLTDLAVSPETLEFLSAWCGEFLIHAADVEGRRAGIDPVLAGILGDWALMRKKEGKTFPVTYAGGVRNREDIDALNNASGGVLDYTVGSALDLFGGDLPFFGLVS